MEKKTRGKTSAKSHHRHCESDGQLRTITTGKLALNQRRNVDETFHRTRVSDYESFLYEDTSASLSSLNDKAKKKSWKKTLTSLFKRKHRNNHDPSSSDSSNRRYNSDRISSRSRAVYNSNQNAGNSEDESSYYIWTDYERGGEYSDVDGSGDLQESLEVPVKFQRKYKQREQRRQPPSKSMPVSKLNNSAKQKRNPVTSRSAQKQIKHTSCAKLPKHQISQAEIEEYSETDVFQSEEYSTETTASNSYTDSCNMKESRLSAKDSPSPNSRQASASPNAGTASHVPKLTDEKSQNSVRQDGTIQVLKNGTEVTQEQGTGKTSLSPTNIKVNAKI